MRSVGILGSWILAGCGDRNPPAPELPSSPALPADVLLQLHLPETGERYRIAVDGRYLVTVGGTETQQPPSSKAEPGRPTVSDPGLGRLREALHRADFFRLPTALPATDCVPAGAVLPNSGRAVLSRPVVFSARADALAHTVAVRADLGAPCTLGPLQPVYEALDREALGGWMNE